MTLLWAWNLDDLRTMLATLLELEANALFVNVRPVDSRCSIVI
jgi:hypothetical protein